ncbi:hypothetical protein P4233_08715 [Pseudomonas aeruginosa]|nr:hypothetical protein [Pseudomonas aeruginosa]
MRSGGKGPEIRTGNPNSSRKASIGSDAGLTLVAARVDNSQAGRIAAKGAIDADLRGLDQHDRGNLVSDTGITLDLNTEAWSIALKA